jgi:hypothetical protein
LTIWGDAAELSGTQLRDIFSWGTAGLGFGVVKNRPASLASNNVMDHATIVDNGLDGVPADGGLGADLVAEDLAVGKVSLTNSFVRTIYEAESGVQSPLAPQSPGARLISVSGRRSDGRIQR